MFMENGNPDKEIFLKNARDILYRHYKPASTSLLGDEQAV